MAQLNIYTFLSEISWLLIINIIVYNIFKRLILIKYSIKLKLNK